ncbi:Hypothetical predicted protein [Podarcis lilfordi]|uniref:Uncharacterized protein n=1 Tax=Podarcis lilfordi TaxID=74358 RepID=A0AA35K7K4_9SAUR|nr:Hypothetical predicted protein [Podarcis lilfordi]
MDDEDDDDVVLAKQENEEKNGVTLQSHVPISFCVRLSWDPDYLLPLEFVGYLKPSFEDLLWVHRRPESKLSQK